jgi:hypothetical protein
LPGAAKVVPDRKAGGLGFERLEVGLKLGEQGAGLVGSGFVLDDEVRAEGLAVLRDEVGLELLREVGVEGLEFGGGEGVGYAFAQRAQADDADLEWWAVGCSVDATDDFITGWKLVEEGDVGWDLVEVCRIVLAA